MKKYDERNTLFSRVNLIKNSKEYEEYYSKNPQTKESDDETRRILFRHNLKKSAHFQETFFPLVSNNKSYIKMWFERARNHPISNKRISLDSSFSTNLKEIVKYFGATSVGIIKTKEDHFYSHHGGLSDSLDLSTYNEVIHPSYETAIVFTVKMDKEQINRAPHFEELMATEEAYLKVAEIGARMEIYLKDLGYKAQHVNSEYYIGPLVPLAHDAGLGEIGMTNHIVTKEYGNNVRLGAVYTTLKVDCDQPIDFGLQQFCKQCALCVMNCPSHSIKPDERIVNGRRFYKFNDNTCYNVWTKMGTDCGTCIQACPLTQGVDLSKLEKIKEEPSLIKELMDEHYNTFGRRNLTKQDLPIVKGDEFNK